MFTCIITELDKFSQIGKTHETNTILRKRALPTCQATLARAPGLLPAQVTNILTTECKG